MNTFIMEIHYCILILFTLNLERKIFNSKINFRVNEIGKICNLKVLCISQKKIYILYTINKNRYLLSNPGKARDFVSL